MPKQMWFGNEQHFQLVPAPATGMNVNNVGVGDTLEYQNGRVGISRSMQTHKVYDMEFPVQEASGLQGIDVFQKYASGFYGDCDSYPLFFADPMNYDQNLFPMGWAAPGLYARGWDSVVHDGAKTYYNLALNPSVEVNTTGYTVTSGTSGTAAGTRTASGPQVSGSWSYRATWTVATSAVSGGVNYTGIPINVGSIYNAMVYVTSSKIQRVLVTVRFRNAALASVGTTLGTQTVLAANTATQLLVNSATAPATATTMDIEVAAVAGTSGANWAIADWIQMDAVMASFSHSTLSTYFDGTTPGAGWMGTPHASSSIMYVARQVPTITDTPANVYNLPMKQGTWNVVSTPNGYPTLNSQYGDIPYALLPIPPGYTLWLGICGSATGTAEVRVDGFKAPGDPASPFTSGALTLLSSTGATRLNTGFSSANQEYVKVYIRRTSNVASTITISSMMAQLWPTGVSPTMTGDFIEGKGHRGLKFATTPTVESYVMVDPNRNIPAHFKGLSTQLTEAQDRS